MNELALPLLAVLLIAYAFAAKWVASSPLTGPMLFAAAGLVLGPHALDWFQVELGTGVGELLVKGTLTLVLFTGASRVRVRWIEGGTTAPLRLLGIGLPLTIAAGTVAGLMFELDAWEPLLLAVILAPTDAALGEALVVNPKVPIGVRNLLSVESGLNDGIAVPFFFVAVDLALDAEQRRLLPGTLVQTIVVGVLVGVAVAVAVGDPLARLDRAGRVLAPWRAVVVLVTPFLAFTLAEAFHGSGFIAAFVAGLVFGPLASTCPEETYDSAEQLGELLTMAVFFLFGALLLGAVVDELDWRIAVYALLSLTLVRIVPVLLSLVGTRFLAPTRLLVGWFGPRGLASVLFMLLLAEDAGSVEPVGPVIVVATWTVAFSIVLHGLSAYPLSEVYGRWYRAKGQRLAHPSAEPTVQVPLRAPSRHRGDDEGATATEGPAEPTA